MRVLVERKVVAHALDRPADLTEALGPLSGPRVRWLGDLAAHLSEFLVASLHQLLARRDAQELGQRRMNVAAQLMGGVFRIVLGTPHRVRNDEIDNAEPLAVIGSELQRAGHLVGVVSRAVEDGRRPLRRDH